MERIISTKEIPKDFVSIAMEHIAILPGSRVFYCRGYAILQALLTKLVICGTLSSCYIKYDYLLAIQTTNLGKILCFQGYAEILRQQVHPTFYCSKNCELLKIGCSWHIIL